MSTYLESDAVTAAKKKVTDHESQRPVYASRWEQELADTLAGLSGRSFSYDPDTDPVYHSYRKAYTRKGQRAMADTLGKTTALTGGYGNSWAHTAAQESYRGYMDELTDKIPQLYALAQAEYDRQTDALVQRYEQYLSREQADRESFDDAFDRWLKELELLQDEALAISKEDYDRYEADREWAAEHPATPGDSAGSSGNASTGSKPTGKPGYDNAGVSAENIKKIQKVLGVTVDGKWGPESYAAAGNVTADVAWQNYLSEFG